MGQFLPLVIRLFGHIGRRRRYQFAFTLGLTFLSSIAEVVSLGAVVPFIGALTQPEKVMNAPLVARIVQSVGFTSPDQLIVPLSVLFALAALVAGILRLLLLSTSVRLTSATGADLSVEVYRRTLYQPYSVHVARSSSEIISGITQKVSTATSVLASLVTIITSAILFAAILLTLLVIDPFVATVAILGFGGAYGLIAWRTRRRLHSNSQTIAREQTQAVKCLQEGLGGIRDVLLDGTQTFHCQTYEKTVRQLHRATAENQYITLAPRYVMEALGMVVIAVLAYVMSRQPGGVGAALPVLGALALGAQRLLPLLQQLYGNWTFVAGSHFALRDVVLLLEQPLPNDAGKPTIAALAFSKSMQFDDVWFRYSEGGPWVLSGFSFTIPKGSRIGLIGTTGSGKSTALDILMSLLEPTRGRVLVDGNPISAAQPRAWQRSIAHVPQSIYLADASIAENIAFGVSPDRIDIERVMRAAKQAQIADFVEARPEGYSTVVGERGVRLSGGQRQRIGIARALYREATVLVFDEATSALDSGTETEVISAINNLNRDLTILMIAHRITTLQNCDIILQLERGQVSAHGPYEHFMNSGALSRKLTDANAARLAE